MMVSCGSDTESMIRSKFSFLSNMLSLISGILNETLVIPAGNVMLYGPEM